MIDMQIDVEILEQMKTNTGDSVLALSARQPVLLVFLRHFGCTFCREALNDISKRKKYIESTGTQLVFVHMTDNETAERYFNRYNLHDNVHVSDPECAYYAAFGLTKGTFTQLFGLHSWIRGFNSGVMQGHGVGPLLGDGFQMPGVFVIQEGEIKDAFIHKLASDRPDYDDLIRNCCQVA